MKRIMGVAIWLIMVFILAGCNTAPVQASQEISVSLEPQRFETEADFVQALKNGDIYKSSKPEDITYYYRPKAIPDGASLQYVQVHSTYIALVYTFDKDKASKDNFKQLTYNWYRYFNDSEDFINNELRRGFKKIELEGKKETTTFLAESSFNIEKEKKDKSGWGICWVQDGQCFSGAVPWSMNEKDIAKYHEMERVEIP